VALLQHALAASGHQTQRTQTTRRPERRDNQIVDLEGLDREGGYVEEEVMAQLEEGRMKEIFDTLTDDQSQVLAVRIIAGLTLEETAAVMSKQVSAVKALQCRALGAMKPAWREER
jgi:DNA-directed RNA polymerase specialized sigma24 family protein